MFVGSISKTAIAACAAYVLTQDAVALNVVETTLNLVQTNVNRMQGSTDFEDKFDFISDADIEAEMEQGYDVGSVAPITEEGYHMVASFHNNTEMRKYIRRVMTEDNVTVLPLHEGHLHGFTPFYSGVKTTQSLAAMRREMTRAVWVTAVSQGPIANVGASPLKEFQQKVENFETKFFVYEPTYYEPRYHGSLKSCVRKGADYMFLKGLENHPNRVENAENADIFVVPCLFESYRRCTTTNHAEKPPTLLQLDATRTNKTGPSVSQMDFSGRVLSLLGENPHPEDFEDIPWVKAFDHDTNRCLDQIMEKEHFKKNGGRDHIWVVADWAMNFGRTSEAIKFKNMSIGRIEVVDQMSAKVSMRPAAPDQSRCSFIVPYASDLAYVEDFHQETTFDQWMARSKTVTFRFEDREYVLYCKADPCPGALDATPLRRKSLEFGEQLGAKAQIAMERVPIDQFISEVHDAKFCLVMRGDTPSTHAFYDALAANCIPILVSDAWEAVAGPFAQGKHGALKGGLVTSEYTIQIGEHMFMSDLDQVQKKLEHILSNKTMAEQLFNQMNYHRSALLWSMPNNIVPDLTLYAAHKCTLNDSP